MAGFLFRIPLYDIVNHYPIFTELTIDLQPGHFDSRSFGYKWQHLIYSRHLNHLNGL